MKNGGGGAPENKLLKGKFFGFALELLRFKKHILPCPPEGEARRISKQNELGVFRFTQNDKKFAFTMAEVLITLGIIAVVAALTIPNLARKWEERAIISKYKKMYATLSNAYNRAVADNGDPEYWDLSDQASLMKIFEPYLNVTERCYYKKGCVSKGEYRALSGETRWQSLYDNQSMVKVRLNGGFSIAVYSLPSKGCEQSCGTIYGIVNNSKGSNYINYMGKDHFSFIVTKRGLYPYGYNFNDATVKRSCSKGNAKDPDDPNVNTNGATCGTWILRYDNMDYFYE